MIIARQGWKIFVFWLLVQICRADVAPFSLTLFGLYGSPVFPSALSNSTANGNGLNVLGEWNFSPYASLGFGYEIATFYGAQNFSVQMLNFESRLFPLENEKGFFSPYLYGGAGLNLSSASAWQGPVQLKLGLGSRVVVVAPFYFDLAVGSHWIQPPNSFQYVDVRGGLSLSFELKGKSQAETKAAPVEKIAPTPTATVKLAGTPPPTVVPYSIVTVTPTPTVVEETTLTLDSAPVTTLAGVKKYYKLGMKAFLDLNYPLSLKFLKKSLASKEVHGASYYYAETYATIGVIYQFHAPKIMNHDQKALDYYKKALAIDPATKSAKHYYKKLKAKVGSEAKKKVKPKRKPKPTPTPSDDLGVSSSADKTRAASN